jgi:hypothetical protein
MYKQNGRIQVIAFQSLDLSQVAPEERQNSTGQYEQVNIPLTVVPPDANAPNTLVKLVELQQIISQEDRASYHDAIAPLVPGYLLECPCVCVRVRVC